MVDKFTGAISNALVGYVAIAAGMTGSATAADRQVTILAFSILWLYMCH